MKRRLYAIVNNSWICMVPQESRHSKCMTTLSCPEQVRPTYAIRVDAGEVDVRDMVVILHCPPGKQDVLLIVYSSVLWIS